MAARTPPALMPGDSAENDRNMLAALVRTPGIVGAADLLVTANGTPNMTVNVAAGAAFIKGTETTYQGMYHVFNDASVSLAIAASDPTNPRIDIVVAQVRDADYSGANRDFRLVVVTGTPAGAPVAPATPADSIVLARVAVAALATTVVAGNITDYRAVNSSASAPQGTLPGGYAQITANQTGITTIVDVTGLAVTVTVGAGRRIRITAYVWALSSSVGTDIVSASIYEGATSLQQPQTVAGTFQTVIWIGTPTADSHTYKVCAARTNGTGLAVWNASATRPSFILVEDIGV